MTKDKTEKERSFECNPHHYTVVGWHTKGGIQNATRMRCVQCLKHLSLEELESKEFAQKNNINV